MNTTLTARLAAAAVSALMAGTICLAAAPASAVDAYLPPIANDDEYSTPQDTMLVVGIPDSVIANDTVGDAGALILDHMNQPSSGVITNLGQVGYFDFTPDAGFVGDVTFSYAIVDKESGLVSNEANVVVHVTAVAKKLVGVPDFYSTPMDTALYAHDKDSVIANDIDVTYVGGIDDVTGEVTVNIYGELDYIPAPGFVGTKTFSYWLDDKNGHVSDPILVTITVTAPTGSVVPGNTPQVPQTPNGDLPTLAYTGAVTSWLVAPALALLALGGAGLWFARRRVAA